MPKQLYELYSDEENERRKRLKENFGIDEKLEPGTPMDIPSWDIPIVKGKELREAKNRKKE